MQRHRLGAVAVWLLLSVEPISFVRISTTVENPVKINCWTFLTCEVTGNFTRILWTVGDAALQSNARTILASENVTVIILGVTTADAGEYRCNASSPISQGASEVYILNVSGSTQLEAEALVSIAAVMGMIALLALITVGVLVHRIRQLGRKKSETYTLATISERLSTLPVYDNYIPSIDDRKERGNNDQPDSQYMGLQFRRESVYDQLKRQSTNRV
ncbi:uncharacterized protein LOC127587216 isoform X2 [Pristis pectinata]|uniref:uncharacterized protein LOC127587216 isoform X2 n=1 Tax=Pristis pectinata TaxID=685728 RepID=UPI00223E2327|nr:uncharacterized protein LOC127587216 isoform X2 [Pristis pectinata]